MSDQVWLFLPAPGEPMLVRGSEGMPLDMDVLTDAVQLWPWKADDLVVYADDPREAYYAADNGAARDLLGLHLRGAAVAVGTDFGLEIDQLERLQRRLAEAGLPDEPVTMRDALIRREVARARGAWLGADLTDEDEGEIARKVDALLAGDGAGRTMLMSVHLVDDEEGPE